MGLSLQEYPAHTAMFWVQFVCMDQTRQFGVETYIPLDFSPDASAWGEFKVLHKSVFSHQQGVISVGQSMYVHFMIEAGAYALVSITLA